MTSRKRNCQAKDPKTCPNHGVPIHKQYIADINDVEGFLKEREQRNKASRIKEGRQIPLKEMNANELAEELREASQKEEWLDPESINSSIELAWILHHDQKRSARGDFNNTPYIEHPLRNAVRLLRLGVKDKDVIIAAVLHDTIEDGSQNYLTKIKGKDSAPEPEARVTLSEHIGENYGDNVLTLVKAVTNDYLTDTAKTRRTTEEKNLTYRNHVERSIRNAPGVILVKISDFIDNAMSLHHHTTPALVQGTSRRAAKYLPVVDVFVNELNRTKLPLPAEGQAKLIANMETTRTRLQRIVEKAEESK